MSQSQHSQRLSQVSLSASAVNECVRFILSREGSKIPIPRADIGKHLINACEVSRNEISAIINSAETVLRNVYGYSLIKEDAKGVHYILTLRKPCPSLQSALIETHEQRLLNVALTHIFMSGGAVKEEDMWTFLTEAKLLDESDTSVRKLFTKKFSSQLYINCVKISETRVQFEWGPRANREVSKMFILKKFAEGLGKPPEYWSEQFKIATNEEQTQRTASANQT